MRSFKDTFETRKRSFISAFSICMTVPLRHFSSVFVRRKIELIGKKDFVFVIRRHFLLPDNIKFVDS